MVFYFWVSETSEIFIHFCIGLCVKSYIAILLMLAYNGNKIMVDWLKNVYIYKSKKVLTHMVVHII